MRWLLAALVVLAVAVFTGAPAGAANQIVDIENTAYDPQHVAVAPGEYVAWCNYDDVAHTATFDGAGAPDIDIPAAESDDDSCPALTFDIEPGVYTYHCKIHDVPAMKGSVTVTAPATTTTIATTTTVGGGPAPVTTTTARRTTTTRRAVQRTAVTRASSTSTSTLPEATTTSEFFDTSTTEFTTTTFGTFAINEPDEGGGAGTAVAVLAGLAFLGGAGYLGYRYRYRFIR